jgi:hypothetical protein
VGRALVIGGVAVACALGGGLGLWARPGPGESPGAAKPAPQALATVAPAERRLHVVVVDALPTGGQPLQVLPRAPAADPAVAPMAPEPQAPRRPPEGLVRVDAPDPGPLALARKAAEVTAEAVERARAEEAAAARAIAARRARALEAARAEARAQQRIQDRIHERAQQRAQARARERDREQAREQAREAAQQRAEARAHAHARAKAQARAEAAREAKARAKAATQVAARRAHQQTAARASAEPPHRERSPELRAARVVRPQPKAPAPRPPAGHERFTPPLAPKGAGPIRVAAVITRCASADPGAALTCGDPALGAALRRLNRAYREAEDAGVPRERLEQQQQRWLASRAAAAREAPWAVREVYQARIAELQDMARSARGE